MSTKVISNQPAIFVILTALYLHSVAIAEIIRVPEDFSVIQAAINAALEGDTILISDGTYTGSGNRNLNFNGKNLVLMSVNGPEYTVLDGERNGRCLELRNGEDRSSIIRGLMFRNF
ncbi:hypothetical protein JW979_11040, partial [bacterium]|nr:hypothetical protein [candidate division CSSED10-310 bacterium]